jgi:hypothetical protein
MQNPKKQTRSSSFAIKVYLPPAYNKIVNETAKNKGVSKSEVISDAVKAMYNQNLKK